MNGVLHGGRSAALAAFFAAVILSGLIVSLASGMPSAEVLDALSVGTAASALVVVMLAFAGVAGRPWGQAGRALALAGMTLVLAGDAVQAVALRSDADSGLLWAISFAMRDGVGNGLFFVSLLVLGMLLWAHHRWIAGLAVANGLLGFLAMAFADGLGLPPHLNFILLVVWFAAIGVTWWRMAAVTDARDDERLSGAGVSIGA